MIDHILLNYETELRNYCRMMTGTPWDADDLFQETVLKAVKAKDRLLDHPSAMAFLFRIASNTWIDECRKRRVHIGIPEGYEGLPEESTIDSFEVKESLDQLVSLVPPFQVVVILLADVFLYRAKEIAEMVETSEGAVKAALHRGRKRLAEAKAENKWRINTSQTENLSGFISNFLEAFRLQDPMKIAEAYLQMTKIGMHAERLHLYGKIHFTFYDPEGNAFTVMAE